MSLLNFQMLDLQLLSISLICKINSFLSFLIFFIFSSKLIEFVVLKKFKKINKNINKLINLLLNKSFLNLIEIIFKKKTIDIKRNKKRFIIIRLLIWFINAIFDKIRDNTKGLSKEET